jgi:hypothetical protein
MNTYLSSRSCIKLTRNASTTHKDKFYTGPVFRSGVKQGDPLSMLLFAIAIEPLIRVLESLVDIDEFVGAFADDIGIVIKNWEAFCPRLMELFVLFQNMSNLHLNISKCVFIPLWQATDLAAVQSRIAMVCPLWANFKVQFHGTYLGFAVGPDSPQHMWCDAIKKAKGETVKWKGLGLGLFFNILVCNVFICSIFSYIGQLATPSNEVMQFGRFIQAKLFSGPGGWITYRAITSIKYMGMPAEVRHLSDMCRASMARIYIKSSLGLNELSVAESLAFQGWKDDRRCSVSFGHWHSGAFVSNICGNKVTLCNSNLWDKIETCNNGQDRKSIQKRAYLLIRNSNYSSAALFEFVRSRLKFWKLDVPIGLLTSRCQNRCQTITSLCKPAIFSAVLRTWLNGWATHERMKHLVGFQCGDNSKCIFCGKGSDNLKHFAHCDVIVAFLDMHYVECKHENKLLWFLLLESNATDIANRARLIAAIHAARMIAYSSVQPSMMDLLHQMAKHYGVSRPHRSFRLQVDGQGFPLGLFDEINCQ